MKGKSVSVTTMWLLSLIGLLSFALIFLSSSYAEEGIKTVVSTDTKKSENASVGTIDDIFKERKIEEVASSFEKKEYTEFITNLFTNVDKAVHPDAYEFAKSVDVHAALVADEVIRNKEIIGSLKSYIFKIPKEKDLDRYTKIVRILETKSKTIEKEVLAIANDETLIVRALKAKFNLFDSLIAQIFDNNSYVKNHKRLDDLRKDILRERADVRKIFLQVQELVGAQTEQVK
ncbi:MAG: hypothetical protein QM526_00060 [Alphaproteobacteria bacterium]|nr:hypothetical protein [Alphaproteobacteria bacterium]